MSDLRDKKSQLFLLFFYSVAENKLINPINEHGNKRKRSPLINL